jgi:hypothetical protein
MSEFNRQALRPTAGEMISFNVMDEAALLKARPAWSSAARLAISLVKDDALNILLMVLKKGERLAEHRTKGPIAVHVLSGSVRFGAESKLADVSPRRQLEGRCQQNTGSGCARALEWYRPGQNGFESEA